MVVHLQASIELFNDFVLEMRSLVLTFIKGMTNLEYHCTRASATTK
jgi:hypothetical protein